MQGTGTVSHHAASGVNPESNPDHTELNESVGSRKKLRSPRANPIDASPVSPSDGSKAIKYGEDQVVTKSNEEPIFDRKLMENISEYSRSQKAKNRTKKSVSPAKWEVNPGSDSTENQRSRSGGPSAERSEANERHERDK